MKQLCLLALTVAACVDAPTTDLNLAASDPDIVAAQQLDSATWENAATLHEGAQLLDHAEPDARRVHSLWIAGSNNNHVPLVVDAKGIGSDDVRIAVLGPIDPMTRKRTLLGADGYAAQKREASVTLDISQPGEHLVVVGSYELATTTTYDLSAKCAGDGCGVSRYDVIANPKDGALVGDPARTIEMVLGDVMVGHTEDVSVELWASPPFRPEQARHVATATTSGTQLMATVPASVEAGDDLKLVVRQADGRTLDTGITTRFAPTRNAFARLDKVLYDDLGSLHIAGVVGTFEGVADLRLFSETRELELALSSVHTDRPGQDGNGWNAFDAAFYPAPGVTPHDGEILSVGYVNGNGDYRRMGCFEYCNNLSGLSSCTGGERSCP